MTWAMAWVEAAIWFVHGLATGDLALLVGGAGGALAATIILVRLFIPRSVGRAWR
ncbi:MAG: hypothetical protein M5U19_02380 [Microthrixaceae bacterium]|nr:hypothetical protein [Microthrixaceae bacterium]